MLVLLLTCLLVSTWSTASDSPNVDAASDPDDPNDPNDVELYVESDRATMVEPSTAVVLAGLNPVTPARILDTRTGNGVDRPGKIGPGAQIDLLVVGRGGVPAQGIDAVALNVTVAAPTEPSFITVWPTGSDLPTASSLNMVQDQTVANLVVAKVGANGRVSLLNAFGSTHVIADVVGWSGSAAHLQSLEPARVLDTRNGTGASRGRVGADSAINLRIAGQGGVPESGVDAVILNVTVAAPTERSFVTVWPAGSARPTASNLNMTAGETNPNLVVTKVGSGGAVSLYNAFGATHLIADVVGWLPTGGAYEALNPRRLLDTRTGDGTYGTVMRHEQLGFTFLRPKQIDFRKTIGTGETIQVDVGRTQRLPNSATAVLLNLTAVNPTDSTFVTAWAYGDERPTASSLNASPGSTVPNLVMVEVGDEGYINLFNERGEVHLIADIVGYFVPRTVDDEPDELTGDQIHVVHLLTSDQPTPTFDDDDVAHTVAVAEEWLRDQRDRGFRFDLSDGQIEITTHRLDSALPELSRPDGTGTLLEQLVADGFAASNKIYLVFIDGANMGNLCGLSETLTNFLDDDVTSTHRFAYVFTGSCAGSNGMTPTVVDDWPNLLSARIGVHELIHAMGAVSDCAPNAVGLGHVQDDPADIMTTLRMMDASGSAVAGTDNAVDAGGEDYWGQGNSTCDGEDWPDLSRSSFLD